MIKLIKKSLPLLFILLLAAATRLPGLLVNPPALFSDEVDIGYQVKSFLATGADYYGNRLPLQFRSFSDVRTALPIYATLLISRLPTISIDQAIRLTPALFSLLAIAGICFLVNGLFSSRPGFWAALFLTLAPWHFTYSRTGFELSMLLAFFIWGLYFYLRYLKQRSYKALIFSGLLLGLLPLIYSTAKLSILLLPFVLYALPAKSRPAFFSRESLLFLALLFLPLFIVVVSGDAAQRFSELAVFTDPTIPTEVNYARQTDLGPNPKVGSSPDLVSRLVHNRPLMMATTIAKNFLGPFSLDYLFVAGDLNLRHAVPGWGMLEKTLVIPFLLGLYLLFRRYPKKMTLLLLLLVLFAIAPSALTRDGATHSSRTFLLLLPLMIVLALGMHSLWQKQKLLGLLFLALLFAEVFLYFHDYWYHYPFVSERAWHAGMKEMVIESRKYPDQTIILSRSYEPPLIFYLYYSDFPPAEFQRLAKQGDYWGAIDGKLNLEGVRFSDKSLYFASLKDPAMDTGPFLVKNAVYFLSRDNAQLAFGSNPPAEVSVIRLPSGEPLFYRFINP